MATKQIPNLPPVIALAGPEQLELVQAGVSRRASLDQFGDYVMRRVSSTGTQPGTVYATNFGAKFDGVTVGVYYGTGDPAFSAAKGSLYTRTDATTTTTRLWVNTTGSTTWAFLTTSA